MSDMTQHLEFLNTHIKEAREGENDIDSQYLLDAIEKDLKMLQVGRPPVHVAELLEYPAS